MADIERLQDVLVAAEALLARMSVCERASAYVWTLAYDHGMAYSGPNYASEKAALQAAIETAKGGR